MDKFEIREIVNEQREFFKTRITLSLDGRTALLRRLYGSIRQHEAEICEALRADLGKSDFESYMCEIGITLSEISYMIRNMARFSGEKTVRTPLAQFASRSYEKPSPYGNVLIMSPWNYPFLLSMEPLVDALAAGNTAVIKPSAYSPNTAVVLQKIISECFPREYVCVVLGGREENNSLLDMKFDYIFFTGSKDVGRHVLSKAAQNLTPVTLELGGKSPCIVDKSAKIPLAAKRIVFGKYLNCGQTCVAPDYILCDSSVKAELVEEIKKQIIAQFGTAPLDNPEYGKIINEKHFRRILSLIDREKLVFGGAADLETLKIAPCVMDDVTMEDAVMQEEIFGPVLPIIEYDSLSKALGTINSLDHPLALYIFSEDKAVIRRVTEQCQFGGGCVNDTIIHLATSEMGFGGVGGSGMGSYHGKRGFDTFSHTKSIVDKKTWLDLPMRYHKYTKLNEKLIRMFLK